MGKAIIFCAPSGAGKTTIVHHLIKVIPSLRFSISATTRKPRTGIEKDGVDYYFISNQEFQHRLEKEEFYEWQEVYEGVLYGTLIEEVQRIWSQNKHVIFDLDVIGALNLKKKLGDKVLAVFVKVPNVDVLRQRLTARSTESKEVLETRIKKAAKEMEQANNFDYILVNDNLETAKSEAVSIVKNFIDSK